MAEIPAPNSSDSEDVSWALETAGVLWKRGDHVDALSWVKRAVAAAREASQEERAAELERLASLLPLEVTGVDVEIDLETSQVIDEIAEVEELETLSAPPGPPKGPPKAPPKGPPKAPPKAPPGPPPAAPPSAALAAPPPAVVAAPAPPAPAPTPPAAVPAPMAAGTHQKPPPAWLYSDENTVTEWPPPDARKYSDENTATEWPPVSGPELPSIEETVTEWPPKGMAADFLASLPTLGAPGKSAPAATPAPAAPEAPAASSVAPSSDAGPSEKETPGSKPRSKPQSAPAPLDLDDDWFDASGPPTFRPAAPAHSNTPSLSALLQRKPTGSLVPPPEVLIRDSSPELAAARGAPPAKPSPEPDPAPSPEPELPGAPPTQKTKVPSELVEASVPPSTVLDELPAFVDIPAEQRHAFLQEAKRKTLGPKESVRGFALGVVLRGEALVTGFSSETSVARLRTGMSLRARGTVGKTLPLRLMAGPSGCEVATWSEAPLNATLHACPWVDNELRAAANPILAKVGVASGLLGSLEPHIFEKLCAWLQPKVLAAGDVALHDGETTPPLVVVGTGSVEVVRAGAVERTLQAGEIILPRECAQGARATVQVRAGADGAVLLQIDKARRQALESSLPAVVALLSGLLWARRPGPSPTTRCVRWPWCSPAAALAARSRSVYGRSCGQTPGGSAGSLRW
jgi:hypothetical protein